ncbi:MAG: hypothetical protein NXI19_14350 [Alphaproteobacteria bacterium]|nr:hypothetical protein [Alphaproteobacteria bacterium]
MSSANGKGLAANLLKAASESLLTEARDSVSRCLRSAVLAVLAAVFGLIAYGLGVTAAILETANHVGLIGAIGIWAAVTALFAAALALASSATGRRPAVRQPTIAVAPAAADRPTEPGRPDTSKYEGDPTYELGRQIGASIPTLPLLGVAAIIGLLVGRRN